MNQNNSIFQNTANDLTHHLRLTLGVLSSSED